MTTTITTGDPLRDMLASLEHDRAIQNRRVPGSGDVLFGDYIAQCKRAITQLDRDIADIAALPLTSIGPGGIGNYTQREVHP